jgi:hypothetical protein
MLSPTYQVSANVNSTMPLNYDILFLILWELILEDVVTTVAVAEDEELDHSWHAILCLGHVSSGFRNIVLHISSILFNMPQVALSEYAFPSLFVDSKSNSARAPLSIIYKILRRPRSLLGRKTVLPLYGVINIYFGIKASKRFRRYYPDYDEIWQAGTIGRLPPLCRRARNNLQSCGLALRSIKHKVVQKEAEREVKYAVRQYYGK